MIGPELDDAISRVQEALDYQGRKRGIDPRHMRSAVELWESLRPEAIPDGADIDAEVFPMQLTEDAQVAIHARSVKIGGSLASFVLGWFSDKDRITPEDMEDFAGHYRMFARAKVGTEMGIAMLQAMRIGTTDVNRGVTRIDPKRFNVSLFEGSVIAEEEFTPEEERGRRARWSLRYILATQHDRDLYKHSSLLDDYEMDYVDQLLKMIEDGVHPEDADMKVIDYFLSKTQPNNRLFGTTAGIEELWLRQLQEVLAFLRDFPTMDHKMLEEVEVRMVDDVVVSVRHLIDDPTLGGTLHKIEGDKCAVCEMDADEAKDRLICSEEARDKLDRTMPLGALPDLYLAKAKLCAPATGQDEDPS